MATSLGLQLGLYLADEFTWQAPFLVLSGIPGRLFGQWVEGLLIGNAILTILLFAEVPLTLADRPDLQAARAVEVLERLATPGARQLLRKWAEAKPPTGLTAQAKESLQRLERVGGNLERKEKTSP